MRTPLWETSAGALAAFLNSTTQVHMADLFTITLSGGGIVRYTAHDIAVTVAGVTYPVGPVIRRGRTRLSVGVSVDKLDLTLAADGTVLVGGVALLPFIAGGGLDGARIALDRAFAAAPESMPARKNMLTFTNDLRNTPEAGATRPAPGGSSLMSKRPLCRCRRPAPLAPSR